MSLKRPRATAMPDWSQSPLLQRAPLKRYAPAPGWRPPLRIRLAALLQSIGWRRAKPPFRNGKPPEAPRRESHWDDPALWMLMLH